MKLKLLVTTILMFSAFPLMADFQTVSLAHEVNVSSLTVPTSQNSRISFNECEDCTVTTVRLTPNTRYSVDGHTVRFDEFRKAIELAKGAEKAGVILLHHLESGTAVSVSITL